jgi:hypothetical protein
VTGLAVRGLAVAEVTFASGMALIL